MSLVSKFIAIYAHVVAIYFDAYGNISLYTCDNFDPSKKLFIFKKKRKRIDTIFINFHLSIVVLLSRCNKYIYIYTTKRSDSRSWPFFDEIRNFKRYSSNILFYQISSRLIEVKVEVEEFNSKRTRKENESVRLETWALVATSSRQFSVNSV